MSPRPATSRLAAELGAILRRARGTLTLDALAARHGLSKAALRELEAGENNPTLARVERAADIYGIDVTITTRPKARQPKPATDNQETLHP